MLRSTVFVSSFFSPTYSKVHITTQLNTDFINVQKSRKDIFTH